MWSPRGDFLEKRAHIKLVLGRMAMQRDAVGPCRGLAEYDVKTVEGRGNEMQKLSPGGYRLDPAHTLQSWKERRGLHAGFQR